MSPGLSREDWIVSGDTFTFRGFGSLKVDDEVIANAKVGDSLAVGSLFVVVGEARRLPREGPDRRPG